MGATINANDILHTLANNITGSTLSPGSASNAGASAKGQELNAYSKAMKIISDNATYINSKSGTDTAAGDLIEEIFFGQQDATENPYTTGSGGAYGGTGNAVVQGNNFANGFNALFIANGIDQLRQIDAIGSDASSTDPSVNASNYRITQAQSGSPSQMTLTLLDKNGSTPTATSAVQYEFRVKSGTAAASLKLGQAETGKATSATTLVLPHTATLGMTNNIEATVYIYAMNNSGTAELAVVNGQRLDESILHTSTAIDGTATSAGVLYATAARTSVAVRLIGRMRITRDNNTVFDEDPTELSIIGVAGGGTAAGELGSGEKINWVDSSVFIQGANNSITIEADDNFVVNTDTLAQLNSTTKVDTVSPTFNSNANSFIVRSVTASKPVIDFMNDGDNSTAPVLRLINNRSGDGADGDEAGRIEFRSKDDGTPTEFITAQMFSNVADASAATKSGIFSLQVTHEGSAVNKIVANSTVVAVTGKLTVSGDMTVSGTTTTVDSTVTTYVDPMIELQTAVGGGAPGTETTKDVGLLMNYHNGSAAKQAFAGFDDNLE